MFLMEVQCQHQYFSRIPNPAIHLTLNICGKWNANTSISVKNPNPAIHLTLNICGKCFANTSILVKNPNPAIHLTLNICGKWNTNTSISVKNPNPAIHLTLNICGKCIATIYFVWRIWINHNLNSNVFKTHNATLFQK